MPDFLSMVERGLKAVRYGIFQASDNLAMLLDGFCRAPEPWDGVIRHHGVPCDTCTADWERMDASSKAPAFFPSDSAASPQVAVVAPSPKQGSDSPPRDSAIPPAPSGGTPTCRHCSEPLEVYAPDGPNGPSVWMHTLGRGRTQIACRATYASPK